MESDERPLTPLKWEEPDETGLADDLPAWLVERVRGFGRRGVAPTGRGSSEGAVAGVICRWQPLGLEFLEEGLEGPEPWEPWEPRDCRDLVERAEVSEELLWECLRTARSVEVLPALRLSLEFSTRLDMTLGNDAKGSEDGWASDGADTSEDAIGRAEEGF